MKENQPKITYMVKCINPDINVASSKYFDAKEEAEQEAIKMEYWVLKKYLKLDDAEFMHKFAKKFWMDNFKIVAKAGPVIINAKDKIVKEETMNLREEILKSSGLLTEKSNQKEDELLHVWISTPIGRWLISNKSKLTAADKINADNMYNYMLNGTIIKQEEGNEDISVDYASTTEEAINRLSKLFVMCDVCGEDEDNDEEIIERIKYRGEQAKAILHKIVSNLGDVKKLNFEQYDFNDENTPKYKQNIKMMYDIVKNY